MAELTKVKGLDTWLKTRKEIESAVTGVIGKIPKSAIDLQVKIVDEMEYPGYVRRRVNYFVDEWARVAAWMFLPEGSDECPAILCCHQQTHRGKDETAGIDGSPLLAFAQHYAELGYATLAPDCITAGERVSSGLEPFDTGSFYKDNPKMSAMGKMLADHKRAIDVLLDTTAVDEARIGVVGHGMGGYNALFLAAFDERIQACVSSCGFTMMSEDDEENRWCKDSGLVLLPKLAKAKKRPFDWDDILALIAPSPTLLITALNDEQLPNTHSCDKALNNARAIYKLLGAEKALENFTHREGHGVSPEALVAADEWLDRWL